MRKTLATTPAVRYDRQSPLTFTAWVRFLMGVAEQVGKVNPDAMDPTPVSLLERLRQPTPAAAWERFVELYTPLLFGWTRRLGLSETDAADLVQDVFAVLVEELPRFRYDPRQSFRAWLKTLLLNKWRNRGRKLAAAPALGNTGLSGIADPVDADLLEETEYRQALVRRALELMRTDFQPVTWRACWEFVACDRPAQEVAAELGISVNAVYLAKSRVLRRLRADLEGLLP